MKKRAHGFLRLGHELQSFTFRRDRYNVGASVDWPNVEMGKSQERRLGARLASLFHVLRTIFQHRNVWRKATLIAARNLDLAMLTLIGKAVTRSCAPFVFEVLDVHPLLAQRNVKGAVLRWVERRVLKRCQLLVVSSPAYLSEYFQRWQGFSGPSYLLENKWSDSHAFAGSRRLDHKIHLSAAGKPQWVIGWFGNLRCPQSFEILLKVAERLPTQVSIYLRGCPSLLGQALSERSYQPTNCELRRRVYSTGRVCQPVLERAFQLVRRFLGRRELALANSQSDLRRRILWNPSFGSRGLRDGTLRS